MKYLALLRGINVGGNSIIKMDKLRDVFSSMGFSNVKTYIQSGNVIFQTEQSNIKKITEDIEISLLKNLKIPITVVVLNHNQLREILKNVPPEWKTQNDLRCYLAFVLITATVPEILKEITLKEGVDFVSSGQGVIYMTTKLSGLTKSNFSKLAGKPIYKSITIRNYNTTKKIAELMELS